jgi:hypothetical protein
MKTLSRVLLGLALVVLLGTGPAYDTNLLYNGDFNGNNALANGISFDTVIYPAAVYDDFIVPNGAVWSVNTVWSNNLMNVTGITQAYWEIRSGVSAGDGGTLVASGTGPATQTATGRSGFTFDEYTIQVTGLNVELDPGTYWLSVSPIGPGSEVSYSFLSLTSGTNAVGQPPGNDDNSFFDSTYANFASAKTSFNPAISSADFSMGVGGQDPVPVPPTVWLLGSGLVGLWYLRRRKA